MVRGVSWPARKPRAARAELCLRAVVVLAAAVFAARTRGKHCARAGCGRGLCVCAAKRRMRSSALTGALRWLAQ
ncbi:MAG: hypothetical protein DWI67_07980 [Chloroflexi bacterium]|nr:MAG: hypothetical protein DWI67_07980 [Chloroflexota bacterium]